MKLLNGSNQGRKIDHTPAIALKGVLVAVQNGMSGKPTQLVILNPRDQSFRTFQLLTIQGRRKKGTERRISP